MASIRCFAFFLAMSRGRDSGHPHVAYGIEHEVGRGVFQVNGHVFQGLLGVRGCFGPSHGFEGYRILLLVQPEGHGVKVVLGTIDTMGNPDGFPLPGGLDGLAQGLNQDDVIVHRIDTLFGVYRQPEALGQFTLGQLDHDGQGAFTV